MRGKLIGLLVCVAILAFPCVGLSEQGDSEKQLTPKEQFRQCLINEDSSWENCANKSAGNNQKLAKQFQFNIPPSAFSERLNAMLDEQKKTGLWTGSLGGLWIPSPVERFTYSPHTQDKPHIVIN